MLDWNNLDTKGKNEGMGFSILRHLRAFYGVL